MTKPQFKNVLNQQHKTTEGKTIWGSRSVCVAVKLIVNGKVLVLKRGSAVTQTGLWCIPCGYIDYNETILEAVNRELYEESGLYFPEHELELYEVMDKPEHDKLQNITFHYILELNISDSELVVMKKTIQDHINGGYTSDEVTDFAFIQSADELDSDLAFGHSERLSF